MSRADFVDQVAKKGDMTKAEAKRAVDLVLGEIEEGLKTAKVAGSYTIGGFGVFSVQERAARTGRNPRTGEEITIGASRSLKFKPAKALRDAAGC